MFYVSRDPNDNNKCNDSDNFSVKQSEETLADKPRRKRGYTSKNEP